MRYFLIIIGLWVSGCVSKTPQTDAFLKKPSNLPPAVTIEGVPFYNQKAGHCGPATLAMALNWAGKPISVDKLAPQVYTPGAKGTFQLDMISATRRQGMLAIPVEGLNALMTEIAAKHPVIVFENLAVSWLPQWHYAIVFGYDIPKQIMVMHSGPENSKRWDMRKFERSWKLADYWGFVVLPPGSLAPSAGEFAHAKATAALEQLGKNKEAEKSYRAILTRWPNSYTASIGLGNILYAEENFLEAIEVLRSAAQANPKTAVLWHNLAIAQRSARKLKEARQSAQTAIALASSEELPVFKESLKGLY
ncbi:MAG: PA2778 family cysteine peptidase [Bdellovibrionota bacterium]